MSIGVTYDTGALVALDRNERWMWLRHSALTEQDVIPTVPAPVLAEAWRGGPRQARLANALAFCRIEVLSERQARAVGELAGRAGHPDIVDVCVVEGALRRGDRVVTSDRPHLEAVVDALGARLVIADA